VNQQPDEPTDPSTNESITERIAHPGQAPDSPTLRHYFAAPDEDDPASAPDSPSAAAGPVTSTDQVLTRRRRAEIRIRTLTFGLLLLAISALCQVAVLTSLRIDPGAVGLTLLIGTGAALVAGGVASARREARGGPGAVR
jgi:hypothetical protein